MTRELRELSPAIVGKTVPHKIERRYHEMGSTIAAGRTLRFKRHWTRSSLIRTKYFRDTTRGKKASLIRKLRAIGRFSAMTLANKITIGRMISVPIVLWAIYQGRFVLALTVFVIAAISDGVDGYIARRYDQKTVLGSILDPLADKFLLTLTFIVLTASPNTLVAHPAWLTVAVTYRDLLIMLGSGTAKWFCSATQFRPIFSSKLTTLAQIMTVSIVVLANLLASLGFNPSWSRTPIQILAVVTGLLCLISVLGYYRVGTWSLQDEGDEPSRDGARA